MNRRGFFGRLSRLGATSAAVALTGASATTHPDDFTYRGRLIHWCGWRNDPNSLLYFGMWAAVTFPYAAPRWELRVQTTLGHLGDYYEMDQIDLSHVQGWPRPLAACLMTDAEREALKQRACRALLASLDAR